MTTDWKIKMIIRALKRLFKTGVTLMEKIEQGEEI